MCGAGATLCLRLTLVLGLVYSIGVGISELWKKWSDIELPDHHQQDLMAMVMVNGDGVGDGDGDCDGDGDGDGDGDLVIVIVMVTW